MVSPAEIGLQSPSDLRTWSAFALAPMYRHNAFESDRGMDKRGALIRGH